MNITSFILGSVGKGAFWRPVLLSFGVFLLLSTAGLSSSSEADEPLFMRSAQQLERLWWSSVLGCTHPGDGTPRSTFETTFEGGGVPSAVDHDYVECGKRTLRDTGSRMLVDTIEDAISRGGVALFSDRFRLDSSIAWVWEESVTGEIDAVIPLFSREHSDGTGQAIFLQPGAVFWQGLNSEDRIDGNLGLAYRQHLTPDVVAGGSVFYDYDFKREHQRVGAGLDLQSGPLQTALNYYHPLNDWQEGRTDYEEQPLQGADFHLGFAWSRIRFDTSFGIWRFEGEEEESTKWHPAFEVGAGYRVYPGVFVHGGYETHDSEVSLDSRWNAGLEFRFSLPGLKGAVDDKVAAEPNLWEPVEREKRILYEEREAIPRIALRLPANVVDENGDVVLDEDGNPVNPASSALLQPEEDDGEVVVVIAGELEALPVEATFGLVVEDSTAVVGEDYSYGHRVYELDAETGEQSPPATAVDCPAAMCEMTVPAGVTRFDVELAILKDAEPKEIREEIVLQVDVPEEHQRALRSGETRLTIEAHDNTVGFDMTNSAGEFVENEGPVEVLVGIDLPSPTPLRVSVTPTSNDDAILDEDYTISTTTLSIPANASSASLMLQGIDNEMGEGSKTITLTLSGSLPPGWNFPADASTYDIILRDDDLAVGFTPPNNRNPGSNPNPIRVEENVGDVVLNVAANQPLTGPAEIAWSVTTGSDELTSATAKSGTLSFTTGNDEDDPQTITLAVMDDSNAEDAEEVEVTLTATTLPEGWSLGRNPHTFTIEPSDGAITFAETTSITAREGETVSIGITSTADGPTGGYPLTVSIPDGTNGSGDITFPATVTLPQGRKTQNFSITINRDNTPEGAETFTMTLGAGASAPADWTVSGSRTINVPLNEGRVSFVDATGTATEAVSSASTTIRAEPSPVSSVTIPITVSAPSGLDYTLQSGGATVTNQITVGSSGRATLTLTPERDVDTRGGVITVRLGTPSSGGYTLGATNSWVVTVNDNNTNIEPDRVVTFEDSFSAVTEGGTAVTTVLTVTPPPGPGTQVTIPVTVTERNNETDKTLTAGSTTVTTTTNTITVDDTGRTTFTLSASNDSDDAGGHITVALGAQLPEFYFPGRRTSWLGIVYDDEAEAVNFAPTSLEYNDEAIMGTVTTTASGGFPTATPTPTLLPESSDEHAVIIAAPLSIPLESGETSRTFEIVPRGGTGDVTLTLTDPEGTLPFDWRIGSDDTLTLTRTSASTPTDKTINLLPSAKNGDATMVEEGSLLEMVVQALGSSSTNIPPEGIDLSLTVENVYVQPVPGGSGTQEVPGSEQPFEYLQGHMPGFKAGAVLPDPHPDDDKTDRGFYRDGKYITNREYRAELVEKAKRYTFKLTRENPSGNIFAVIDDDGMVENAEKITFKLDPVGNLPSGWTMGTRTYEITVPSNGISFGFVPNPPKRTVEGVIARSPANLPESIKDGIFIPRRIGSNLDDERFISLPFECTYPSGSTDRFTVDVTGVDLAGTPLTDIYVRYVGDEEVGHLEVGGQVITSGNRANRNPTNPRTFNCSGTGRVQRTNIGIRVRDDDKGERTQIFTIKVSNARAPSGAVAGNLEHTLIVMPSDIEIDVATPVPGSVTNGNSSVILFTLTPGIPAQSQADKDDGIPLPRLLIVPASTNTADPGDYTLSVSNGAENLETIPAGGGEPEKYVWTLPIETEAAAQLTVTADTGNSRELKLDVTAVDPLLGWDLINGLHTISVRLNP